VRVALTFEKYTSLQQGGMVAAAFVATAAFAPLLLRIRSDLTGRLLGLALALGVLAVLATWLATHLALRRYRYLMRSLAMGSLAIEELDIAALRSVPFRLLSIQLTVGAAAWLAFRLVRPPELAAAVADELALFGFMTVLATGVPGYVLVQSRVGRLLEASPLDTVTEHLIEISPSGSPRRLSRRNLAFAVIAPVALVGVGGVLSTYAHLRAIHDESRGTTAWTLGRGVVGAGGTLQTPGQNAAARAARASGYEVTISGEAAMTGTSREDDDSLVSIVALPQGSARVRYRSDLGFETSAPLALGALAIVGLAVLMSQVLARVLSRDVARASRELAELGTDAVLRGEHAPIDARFESVAELLSSARELTERFRVFAAAQERSLEAKEVAQRTRGLLFASVSHDLKSPLNAIVGFAESIDTVPLCAAQRESLELIATRGRELVALIETILDAARVEAGELRLTPAAVDVRTWLLDASRLARRLAPAGAETHVDHADGLPRVVADPVYLGRALAIVMAHAMRSPTIDGAPAAVVVWASPERRGAGIRVEVRYPEATTTTEAELAARFEQGLAAGGRGLTLALGLSRSVVELHRGTLRVERTPRGAPVVVIVVPRAPPPHAATSGSPSLGASERAGSSESTSGVRSL
jgi:signal transduction histidine kinase